MSPIQDFYRQSNIAPSRAHWVSEKAERFNTLKAEADAVRQHLEEMLGELRKKQD
jgi:hypothetical protein